MRRVPARMALVPWFHCYLEFFCTLLAAALLGTLARRLCDLGLA
jgi:hypothetical protein